MHVKVYMAGKDFKVGIQQGACLGTACSGQGCGQSVPCGLGQGQNLSQGLGQVGLE